MAAESEVAPLVPGSPAPRLIRTGSVHAFESSGIPWWRCWRFRTSLTAALGEAIVYGQRISVPIALVAMQAELNWTKETQGVVMTGFWVGYAAMQIPGGWLTTRWGPRRVVGAGLCTSSALHLCMPMAAATSSAVMTALRVLQGVSQGVMVPGYAVLWSSWAPPAERSQLSSLPQIGGYVGQIMQLAIAGWQIDLKPTSSSVLGGWEAVFLLNSVLGLAWMALWFSVVYDHPAQNPRCSAAERAYIEGALAEEARESGTLTAAPQNDSHKRWQREEPIEHSAWSCSLYKRMSRSQPVLAICAASFCHNIGNYMLVDGFPAYARDVAGASMTSAGLASAVPQIAVALLTTLGAVAADFLRGPHGPGLSTRTVRRIMHTVGTGCNALLLLLVGVGALDGVSEAAIVAVLSCAVGVAGLTVGGGFGVNHLDVAAQILPTAAGLLLGVVNMFGSTAGALAPYIMARLTEYPEGTSREQWEQLSREPTTSWLSEVKEGWGRVFMLACCVDILGVAVYGTFASGERQAWSPRTTSLAAQKSEGPGQFAAD